MVESTINRISNTEYDSLISKSFKNNVKEKTIISGKIVKFKSVSNL